MFERPKSHPRRGTVLPLLGCCLIALFSFVALAVDLGMVAVARTDAQNAADVAALTGTRALNNKPGVANSDSIVAIAKANAAIQASTGINSVYTAGEIQSVKVGQYSYDTSTKTFAVSYPATIAAGQSWTAMEVIIAVQQPTYFMRIWGVNSMPTGARAVAVHRPRDIALAIDMTGSMGFGSIPRINDSVTTAGTGKGLNDPNTMWPQFAHMQRYTSYSLNAISNGETSATAIGSRPNPYQQMGTFTSAPYIYAPANLTIETPNGKPIVRDFYYVPTNISNPASPVASADGTNFRPAFHQWSPAESGADPSNYIGPTYSMGSYNAFDTTGTTGAIPAPDNFKDQTDLPNVYVGDKFPRKSGATSGAWISTGASGAAINLAEYLGWSPKYTGVGTFPGSPTARTGFTPTTAYVSSGSGATLNWTNFRDATWERYGYDLDVAGYVAGRGTWDPRWDWDKTLNSGLGGWAHTRPSGWSTTNTFVPSATAGTFKGYSMGPGYFGKTFCIWPPDPRTPVGNPGAANYQPGDWRRRYFNDRAGNTFDPQSDADKTAAGWQNIDGKMLTNGTGLMLGTTTNNYSINYAAILLWIKSGPMVLPPNLRAGHVLYYSSIPDSVTASGLDTAGVAADKVFWKNYIDYVLLTGALAGPEPVGWPEGITPNLDTSAATGTGYPLPTSPGYFNANSTTVAIAPTNGATKSGTTVTITTTATHGFSVGQNIVIDSVALAGYNGTYTIATVPSTTKFTYTQAAGALAASGGGNAIIPSTNDPLPASVATNNPSRPRLHTWFGPMTMMMFLDAYNFWAGSTHQAQSWQLKAGVNSALDDIRNNHPNDYCGMAFFTTPANNSFYYKDPVVPIGQDFTSLKNSLFFPKSLLTTLPGNSSLELRPYSTSSFVASYGDIPNSQSSTDPVTGMALAFNILSPAPSLNTDPTRLGRRGASKVVIFETDGIPNATQTFNLTKAGYNSYYTYGNASAGATTAAASTAATDVVTQICKPTAINANTGVDSGYSLPNAPARVYAIGFGDIFSTTAGNTALSFLLSVQQAGNTSAATDTSIPSYQIITGTYQTRIDNLRSGLERILQGGVQVTLVE